MILPIQDPEKEKKRKEKRRVIRRGIILAIVLCKKEKKLPTLTIEKPHRNSLPRNRQEKSLKSVEGVKRKRRVLVEESRRRRNMH